MRKDTKVNFDCSKYWKMEYLYLPAGGGWKVFGSQRRRLENLEKFPLIGGGGWGFSEKISGGGGSAARLTPLSTGNDKHGTMSTETISTRKFEHKNVQHRKVKHGKKIKIIMKFTREINECVTDQKD
jgi:hypothetical protein